MYTHTLALDFIVKEDDTCVLFSVTPDGMIMASEPVSAALLKEILM